MPERKKRRYVRGTVRERFWAYVQKSDVPNACWPWEGTSRPDGYGVLRVDGRCVRAPRLSYELNVGEIASGLFVCHTCDNPSCVNPDHLFLGTLKDNVRDSIQKNRFMSVKRRARRARGERVGTAKLTAKEVCEIRRLHREKNMSAQELAGVFSVTPGNIDFILSGKTWAHL